MSIVRSGARLQSCVCTQRELLSPRFQGWARKLGEEPRRLHRKIWEYCYIAEALSERHMLEPGRHGLGFAVGQEPLAALFASMGCDVLATDLAPQDGLADAWIESNQHADSVEALNTRALCEPGLFRARTRFRYLDMRQLPDDLGRFDFVWSACAAEHLGSLTAGIEFLVESSRYLAPGGVAVHTVEYNASSNSATISDGPVVLFRRRDLRQAARSLLDRGYRVQLDFSEGTLPGDVYVDPPPYKQEVHLKLDLAGYAATSFGLIIEG